MANEHQEPTETDDKLEVAFAPTRAGLQAEARRATLTSTLARLITAREERDGDLFARIADEPLVREAFADPPLTHEEVDVALQALANTLAWRAAKAHARLGDLEIALRRGGQNAHELERRAEAAEARDHLDR